MQADEIANLLPEVYRRSLRHDNSVLRALLESMECLLSPAERAIRDFPKNLNPRTTKEKFLTLLIRWLDLEYLFERRLRGRSATVADLMPTGSGRLRELIAVCAQLSDKRGTEAGLRLFLEVATGVHGFVIEEGQTADGAPRAFHLCIRGPEAAEPHRQLIEQIIRSERPAHLTFEFVTTTKDEGHGDKQ